MTEREKKLEDAIKRYVSAIEFDVDDVLQSMSCGCAACQAMILMYALVTEGVEIIHVDGDGSQGGNLH